MPKRKPPKSQAATAEAAKAHKPKPTDGANRFGRECDARRAAATTARAVRASAADHRCASVGEQQLPLLPAGCGSLVLRRCAPGVLAVASEVPGAFTDKHQEWIGSMGRLLAEA